MSRLDSVHPLAQADHDGDEPVQQPDHFGPWLTTRDAQRFIPCKSLKATYEWIRRHGIVRRGNGSVARADLQRELDRMKRQPRRTVHANSLANLRRREA